MLSHGDARVYFDPDTFASTLSMPLSASVASTETVTISPGFGEDGETERSTVGGEPSKVVNLRSATVLTFPASSLASTTSSTEPKGAGKEASSSTSRLPGTALQSTSSLAFTTMEETPKLSFAKIESSTVSPASLGGGVRKSTSSFGGSKSRLTHPERKSTSTRGTSIRHHRRSTVSPTLILPLYPFIVLSTRVL